MDRPNGEELRAHGVEAWLADAVDRLSRGDPATVETYLCTVGQPIALDGTAAMARTHFVQRDVRGMVRVQQLAEKLAQQVVDYCIPRSRIAEAQQAYSANGSTEKLMQLGTDARKLFTALATSGEGGELLLYFLLEVSLQIPQILCKMSLKTSTQMHYHGADGVHAKAHADGTVSLYWGEAKMHASVNSAIDECFESIAPFLTGDTKSVIERDLILVRDHLDVGSNEAKEELIGYFVDDDPRSLKLDFRGACLVGFDLEDYPNPFENDGTTLSSDVAAYIEKWHRRLAGRIERKELQSFEIEIFCVPFPSVSEFRTRVRESIGVHA